VPVRPSLCCLLQTTISALWDLQYSVYLESLVAVAGYSLYTIDGSTGKTKRVGAIIDGPGCVAHAGAVALLPRRVHRTTTA